MQPLRRLLDRVQPYFDKGGKLEKLYPVYESIDTFLYTPGKVTSGMTHVRDALDMKRMMITVVLALGPCILMAMYNTGLQANMAIQDMGIESVSGWRPAIIATLGLSHNPESILANFMYGSLYFLPVYLISMIVGGTWEMIFSIVRRKEVNEGFLVTGVLFPLTLPPTIPLWQVAIGISFGVVIGKEVFGGTGKNFLNPALTARAFLYFAYPAQLVGDAVWTAADGFSGATPLGALAVADINTGMKAIDVTWGQAFLGTTQGSMGETSTLACVFGAIVLVVTGIGSWRIMAGVLIGGLGLVTSMWMASSSTNAMFVMPPWWHLVVGGYAFGLVFMATDPVSASMTHIGKWIYGLLIGLMTMLIRVINPAYPEGIMLAILFGNVFAPLIDYFVVQVNIRRRSARYEA